MDLVDLEAAIETSSNKNLAAAKSNNDQSQERNLSMDQPLESTREQDARLYGVAKIVIEEVLRALPGILRQHLGDTDSSLDMVASAEKHTVLGAQENVSPTYPIPSVDHSRLAHSGRENYDRAGVDVSTRADDDGADGCFQEKLGEIQPGNSPQNHRSSPGYEQRVAVLTPEDVETENELRRETREKWRGTEDWDYLEDPWKHVQRDGKPLFKDSSLEQRKDLQLCLIDAILSGSEDPDTAQFLKRGLPAIACWISLIGSRLGQLYKTPDGAMKQAEILIECIWICKSCPSSRVCDVLLSCFRRGIFEQPNFDETSDLRKSMSELRIYIAMVHVAIFLLNIVYKHDTPQVDDKEELEDTWLSPLSVIEVGMRMERQEPAASFGGGTFFSVGDLGLRDLQTVGRLQIQWTDSWDEHLELETKGHLTALKLYWFSLTLSRFLQTAGLCGGIMEDERADEVARSLDLILNPYGKRKRARAAYEDLEAPEWLEVLALEDADPRRSKVSNCDVRLPLARFQIWRESGKPKFCWEVADHMTSWDTPGPDVERITSTRYPFYHQRLRELRCYMDSRQPNGLLALWRDRRNSNLFYTFWLVIVFGAISIGLGFGTLAVAIVQAWAQLKSLQQ